MLSSHKNDGLAVDDSVCGRVKIELYKLDIRRFLSQKVNEIHWCRVLLPQQYCCCQANAGLRRVHL